MYTQPYARCMGSNPLAETGVIKYANCSLINSIMFNKFFNNQVIRHGHSDCADYIIVNVAKAQCIVAYTNGTRYLYEGVSRRALLKLMLQPNISLGRWINDNLLYCNSKCAQTGHTSKFVVCAA